MPNTSREKVPLRIEKIGVCFHVAHAIQKVGAWSVPLPRGPAHDQYAAWFYCKNSKVDNLFLLSWLTLKLSGILILLERFSLTQKVCKLHIV
jgi:hypothetical protein